MNRVFNLLPIQTFLLSSLRKHQAFETENISTEIHTLAFATVRSNPISIEADNFHCPESIYSSGLYSTVNCTAIKYMVTSFEFLHHWAMQQAVSMAGNGMPTYIIYINLIP